MAPFRGRGHGRGGSRASRGSSRGGRGNGRVAKQSGKLARSGIRTRAGYRKFDSQRVKDVESGSEDEALEVQGEAVGQSEGLSDDKEVEEVPKVKAYNALLQGLQQDEGLDRRRRKRRNISSEEPVAPVEHQADVADHEEGDSSVGAEDASTDEEDGEEAHSTNGDANHDTDDGDNDDTLDPFEAHFASIDDNELSKRLKDVQANDWRTEKHTLTGIGSLTASTPRSVGGNIVRKHAPEKTSDLPLKKRLADACAKHFASLDDPQQALAPYVFNYIDLLFANRTPDNASSLRHLACLHVLNHVLKGRDKVLKNTARLAQSDEPETLDLRDQGFTRPKVLILTETRQMAYKYGNAIVDLFQPEQVENRQRFKDSFSGPIDDSSTMPNDYRELFEGNNDNSFLTALKFTRKTLKYFSAFYASDIILASPLGLRRLIENEDKKKQDHDFLSSIEIVIADQADAMQMQYWENIDVVFRHLNLQPRSPNTTDFSRVRSWYLDGHAQHLRQTLLFSAYATPEINRLYNTSLLNIAGKAKLLPVPYAGIITSPAVAGLGIKQTFSRFDSPSPAADPDARFKFFTSAILPSLLRIPKPADGAQGILLFIPSYFDFIRVRNFFATSSLMQNISFGAIHDYTPVPEQRRARSHFLAGRHSILLYTQRAHHFFRLRIKGVKRVVFYGVPDNPVFYEEVVGGFLGSSIREGVVALEEAGVRVVSGRWEGLGLERVVGSQRVKGMLGGMGDVFDFV